MKRLTIVTAVLVLLGMVTPSGAAEDVEEGFQPIFNGKSLDGWEGDPDLWQVEDGAITGRTNAEKPLKHNSFLIWREGEVGDFELRLEYRLEGGNSGIQYRSWQEPESAGKWVIGGYQADIADNAKYTGILYGERFRGILALRGQKVVIGENHKPTVVEQFADSDKLQSAINPDGWNQYRIVARDFHFIHEINGQKMIEAMDEDTEMRRPSGLLALQVHVGPPMKVQFRNIRLKRWPAQEKKVALIAGPRSHGYGSHEHNAGCALLAKLLNENVPGVRATVYRDGWPADEKALDGVDAIVLFADGGARNPILPHVEVVDRLMKKRVGLATLHYAVEVPKGEPGNRFLDWTGGYFEGFWSVNPHFEAAVKPAENHPIARGVRPFVIEDEWYYHMRFRENMEGVTPILTTVPPDSTRERPDGHHSGNPAVRARKGMPEILAWARQRPDGGRGFGFTGGHWHWNWGNDQFRKVVLNGIVWISGLDVPEQGVCSKTPAVDELVMGLDDPPPTKFNRDEVAKKIEQWNRE
ncbi:MAG: DUF1080 domain-containing protein [Rhodopirellula sp.]|nr:DUF1080 domain-containing protein [Rhodopirellula sp.]